MGVEGIINVRFVPDSIRQSAVRDDFEASAGAPTDHRDEAGNPRRMALKPNGGNAPARSKMGLVTPNPTP